MAPTSLALGLWWGLATVPLVALGFAIRIRIEERTVREGLSGYDDYARHVRWRLFPRVWYTWSRLTNCRCVRAVNLSKLPWAERDGRAMRARSVVCRGRPHCAKSGPYGRARRTGYIRLFAALPGRSRYGRHAPRNGHSVRPTPDAELDRSLLTATHCSSLQTLPWELADTTTIPPSIPELPSAASLVATPDSTPGSTPTSVATLFGRRGSLPISTTEEHWRILRRRPRTKARARPSYMIEPAMR